MCPGPPPGVHMPGPSFRPILGAIGTGVQLGITGGEKGRVVKRRKK